MLRRRSFLYIRNYVADYVEIGGIKWGTQNLGANSITDYGKYYQWADTQGYTASQIGTGDTQIDMSYWETDNHTYKYWDDGDITKYSLSDSGMTLDASDDAAHALLGGYWRMPTSDELQTLIDSVDISGITIDGVEGMLCIDKTDNAKTLFFPFAGFADNEIMDSGSSGCYWSSNRYDYNNDKISVDLYVSNFNSDPKLQISNKDRFFGLLIRPIYDEPLLPEYVEIGGVKWATKNLGAASETDTGLYFQWGDVSGYTADQIGSGEGKVDMSAFQTSNHTYKYYKSSSPNGMSKYNTNDNKWQLDASDDAANVILGVDWRTPTSAECQALIDSVNMTQVTSGVEGILCEDKTDSSKTLFFPHVGNAGNQIVGYGTWGYYWTKDRYDNYGRATLLASYDTSPMLSLENHSVGDSGNRYLGMVIRPVYDPYRGHEYVEIGGKKWATMNIGANSISDYGLFFAWGETLGYPSSTTRYYGWNDYKYEGPDVFTKYNDTDGKTVLDLSGDSIDDAARINWGGRWRMPTYDDFQNLMNSVNTAWIQVNGVNCVQCTDKNDPSKVLYLPVGGRRGNGITDGLENLGMYWSSSLSSDDTEAWHLWFANVPSLRCTEESRFYGTAVRPICD